MERRLSKQLQNKISNFDIKEPYVWKLRLTETDFKELEACLQSCALSKGISYLTNDKSIALLTFVYIAEWYKRRYQSNNKIEWMEGLSMGNLWESVGVSQKTYLFLDESGNKRWLYSIYVLGGLAIQHELNRNDGRKFLKALCRIYHGEDYTPENLDEASRAIAFRESIKRKQSLYEYMRAILNGEASSAFDEDELKDEGSDINRFISAIKLANDEIWNQKFRFEWVVNFSEDNNYMSRHLNIWLKPEEVSGGLHQYLRYDRVRLWGLLHPETQQHLTVYIRFKKDEKIVEPSTMESPIVHFLNHGIGDFVAMGAEKIIAIKHIPTKDFNKIELIVKDDEDNEYIAQTQDTQEYLQLWRKDTYSNFWTSTQNAQKETAIVFSSRCHLYENSIAQTVVKKSFKDKKYGVTVNWSWSYIYDSVSITDENDHQITLYNRVGYDQITTRLYSNIIQYINGGYIRHHYIDEPEISNELETEELPLIFGREDIIARHFSTKNAIQDAEPEKDTEIEEIKYGQATWTEDTQPEYGALNLKVMVKGKVFPFRVIYLPRLDEENPIKRDFEHSCVRYLDLDKKEKVIEDEIKLDRIILSPTIKLTWGNDCDYYEADIFRPTLIKEVLLDDNIIEYLDANEKLALPYIFKDRVKIHDFSQQGYQAYDCKNLGNIYTDDYLLVSKNPSSGMAALFAWQNDNHYSGKLLDPNAPSCLEICFGLSKKQANWQGQVVQVWSYDKNEEPTLGHPDDELEYGIIFQDLSKNKDLTCNYPIIFDDGWGWEDIESSPLKCFLVANEADTYFFLMKPLLDLDKKDIPKEVYEPLIREREGALTEKDKKGLIRLSQEFAFQWEELDITII